MKIRIKNLLALFLIFLLAGCGNKPATLAPAQSSSSSSVQTAETITPVASPSPKSTPQVQEHLFEAKNMDTIELTGQDILDGKAVDMSVAISDNIQMDFHLSRDNPNGVKLYAIYNAIATNFAYTLPGAFDSAGEAIPDYTYQISCYDFNHDGVKEVIIACGNKKDSLSLYVLELPFELPLDSEIIFTSLNYILGYTSAYVNDSDEICVPSPAEVKTYQYDIKAYDSEDARLSGPLKISADYVTEEQLKKYKNIHTFVLLEGGPDILILPKETLKDLRISYVEYDADNDKFNEIEYLYTLPTITPDEPLVLQFAMPTIPSIKVSYTDESGMKQSSLIAESGLDGTLFLIEQGRD